jgi:hypothetical protein
MLFTPLLPYYFMSFPFDELYPRVTRGVPMFDDYYFMCIRRRNNISISGHDSMYLNGL